MKRTLSALLAFAMLTSNLALAYDPVTYAENTQNVSLVEKFKNHIMSMSDSEKAGATEKLLRTISRAERRISRMSDEKFSRRFSKIMNRYSEGTIAQEVREQTDEALVAGDITPAEHAQTVTMAATESAVPATAAAATASMSKEEALNKLAQARESLSSKGLSQVDDDTALILAIVILIALIAGIVALAILSTAYWPLGLALFAICVFVVIMSNEPGFCWFWI